MFKYLYTLVIAIILFAACNNKKANTTGENMKKETITDDASLYLLVGTYTQKESKGIYVYKLDTISGSSEYVSMAYVDNPSYLAVSNDEKYVYAITENGKDTDAAHAFVFVKEAGALLSINSQPVGGKAPCYVTADSRGRYVITANYLGGSISALFIKADGSLAGDVEIHSFTGKGVDKYRQTQPHLHCVQFSPDGNYLFATDLGTDRIHRFEVSKSRKTDYLKSGEPESFKVADGSGPRHLEFHPNGKYAYLITEMGGTVIAFNYGDGILTEFQTIVADTLQAKGSGDIHITPDGRFLYASNRLQGDGLTIFSIDQNNGMLTKIGYQETGIHPRNFVITPNGKYLLVACRDSDLIQIFAIDRNTGLLESINKDIELSMPVCLKFVSTK